MASNRLLLATALAVSLGLSISPASAAQTRPNIVLILSDDSGYSDLGCYGSEIQTPVLDRLAAGGLRLTDMYSTGRCWPSRAALMTAYYPQQVGMDPITGKFPDWVRPLPLRLQEAGYRSFHAGKWHISNATPTECGFIPRSDLEAALRQTLPDTDGDLEFGFPFTEAYTQDALHFLADHAAHHEDAPFFLYVGYRAPHFPLRALEKDIAPYRHTYDVGWEAIRQRRAEAISAMNLVRTDTGQLEPTLLAYDRPALEILGPGEVYEAHGWNLLTEPQKAFQATKMAIHAAMITRMDREIGRIVKQLEQMDALQNTLFIYLSDNGASAEMLIRDSGHDPTARAGAPESYLCLGPGWAQASNSPFRFYKMYAHEGGVASPAIFHWPAIIKEENGIRRRPAHFIDVAATVLDVAGLPVATDGMPPTLARSLVPLLKGDAELETADLYFRHRGKALRREAFKVVSLDDAGNDWALYNMLSDRGELHDLSSAFPALKRSLVERWEALDASFKEHAQMSEFHQ